MNVPVPARIAKLPVNKAGYRVPWFVLQTGEREWDFRVIRPRGPQLAHTHRLCWVCGQPLSAYKTFVVGPMCVINRVSSEPPSHHECAMYSAMACPFLTKPNMRRRETGIDDTYHQVGMAVLRNPGVTAVWTTRRYTVEPVPAEYGGGALFNIGEPHQLEWVTQGRPATRAEVLASIEEGYPQLLEAAEKDGARGLAALTEATEVAMALLPKEAA